MCNIHIYKSPKKQHTGFVFVNITVVENTGIARIHFSIRCLHLSDAPTGPSLLLATYFFGW